MASIGALTAQIWRERWSGHAPGAAARRALRRLLGAEPAAIVASADGERWKRAVVRLRPAARFLAPEDVPRIGPACAELGLRHLDLCCIDGARAAETLAGAASLLAHARIDMIALAASGLAPEVAGELDRYGFDLYAPAGARLALASADSLRRARACLAIHRRLRPLVVDGPKRMLDIAALSNAHGIAPRGVIHVGAHEGAEWAEYARMGVEAALFIEANPAVFARLEARLGARPGVTLANCAIADRNGSVTLHVTSSDQSSSILPLHRHRRHYPTIVETEAVEVRAMTLDALLDTLHLPLERFNLLNLDIQGAELIALAGAERVLRGVAAINVEVSFEELYEGCAEIEEIDDFLGARGFERVAVTCPFHKSWGDAFYVRRNCERT